MHQTTGLSTQVFCLIYVPIDDAEKLKHAIFQAGGGRIGEYQGCAWQVAGEGQFIPSQHANPSVGQARQNTKVSELCIHCVCSQDKLADVIQAIKDAHPYETPAYVCLPCLNV
jgi:structural hemagglutinin/hemolysin toxin protein RtxA